MGIPLEALYLTDNVNPSKVVLVVLSSDGACRVSQISGLAKAKIATRLKDNRTASQI
jgi:hypothetical protein